VHRIFTLLRSVKNIEFNGLVSKLMKIAMSGTSRTIVFVGERTSRSCWVREEVMMTIDNSKPVYAIRLKDTSGPKPKVLEDNGIYLYSWSEECFQALAIR